jgi:hypothetical protein
MNFMRLANPCVGDHAIWWTCHIALSDFWIQGCQCMQIMAQEPETSLMKHETDSRLIRLTIRGRH